jgi:hypothetical protein
LCIARISNPKEEVPGNVKAIMLMLADISPKANEIFGVNFGGVNIRTMQRWTKARKANTEYGLDILDLSSESIERSLFDMIRPMQLLMKDVPVDFSLSYEETTVHEFLEATSFGAVVVQIFPNQTIKTDRGGCPNEWNDLQRILKELKELSSVKKASGISPLWLWKAIPTNKASVKLMKETYPIQRFVDIAVKVGHITNAVLLAEAGDGAFAARIDLGKKSQLCSEFMRKRFLSGMVIMLKRLKVWTLS